jgi:uncharacterized protein YraI
MKRTFAIAMILVLLLAACTSLLKPNDSNVDVQTAIEQTMAVQNAIATFTAQTQGAPAPVVPVAVEPTAIPTIAIVPATAVPPTAESSVEAKATKNANCRSGPATNFDYIGVLNQGETAKVIGHNLEFGKWWQVVLADGKQCWVIEDAVNLSGDTNSVAMINSPKTPTPIPAPDWNGKWTIWMSGGTAKPTTDMDSFSVTMVQKGNVLTFSYSAWGQTFFFTGTVSADGMTVSANEGGDMGYSGLAYFVRNPSNLNQFRGRWYIGGDPQNDGTYCGSKNGAPMPDPCRP